MFVLAAEGTEVVVGALSAQPECRTILELWPRSSTKTMTRPVSLLSLTVLW